MYPGAGGNFYGDDMFGGFGERLAASGVTALRAMGAEADGAVITGLPAQMLMDLAPERADVLIVMSAHGTADAGRWMRGSVAGQVVAGSAGPLVLVRSR